MLKELFLNWEETVSRLQMRGLTAEQLSNIRAKWTSKNQLQKSLNQLRKEKNQLSKQGKTTSKLVVGLNQKIKVQAKKLAILLKECQELGQEIPNLPHLAIPKNNQTLTKTFYQLNQKTSLTYWEIASKLGIINPKASIKLSGSRFAVYQGIGAQLVQALISLMLKEQRKKGYQLFSLPYLVREQNLYQTGQLPKLKEDMFKIENHDLYLIPTAEVPLVNLYQGEILNEKDLPLKLLAYSPCFRGEAGAGGQENRGLIRLHQFHKVELVALVHPENSYQYLEQIVTDARDILHLLKISHRVIELSAQELGFNATKTYDLEIWLPNSQRWLEISSCSNCESFQTTKAQIRVKKINGQKYYPHSLNGSSLAIDRLIVALLEYYYNQETNCLELPTVLEQLISN